MMRGQLSMEFVLVFVFSMLVFVILFGLFVSGFADQEQVRIANRAEGLSRHLALTIDLIESGPSQATYEFTFPPNLGGFGYTVEVLERFVFVTVDGSDIRSTHPIRQVALSGDALDTTGTYDVLRLTIDPQGAPCQLTIAKDGDTEVSADDCP